MRGRYYLGRVQKFGKLDNESLLKGLWEPSIIKKGKYHWTFTDTSKVTIDGLDCYFSHLSKYSSEGYLTVVDTSQRLQREELAENLLVASSPFVYLPEFSGIIYLHVWNFIPEKTFRNRFSSIITELYDRFFVDCEIELISDYRKFIMKLKQLDEFNEITAKVYPPNPLFGDLWKDLNDYIKKRNTSELKIDERSNKIGGISTNIVEIVEKITESEQFGPEDVASITDAAVLMAADGYGSSKIVGKSEGDELVISTNDTKKSILFDKDPLPEDLAVEAIKQFSNISDERQLDH